MYSKVVFNDDLRYITCYTLHLLCPVVLDPGFILCAVARALYALFPSENKRARQGRSRRRTYQDARGAARVRRAFHFVHW